MSHVFGSQCQMPYFFIFIHSKCTSSGWSLPCCVRDTQEGQHVTDRKDHVKVGTRSPQFRLMLPTIARDHSQKHLETTSKNTRKQQKKVVCKHIHLSCNSAIPRNALLKLQKSFCITRKTISANAPCNLRR